jgi:hypothetical protein
MSVLALEDLDDDAPTTPVQECSGLGLTASYILHRHPPPSAAFVHFHQGDATHDLLSQSHVVKNFLAPHLSFLFKLILHDIDTRRVGSV